MGIQGLLPFLKEAQTEFDITKFKGCVAAVDIYCWLHQGCYSCGDQLFAEQDTDRYVDYCMSKADVLIKNQIRPIFVFDGQNLPSKVGTDQQRAISRERTKEKIQCLLSDGGEKELQEARKLMKSSVEVTFEMAKKLIEACRENAIDYLVAPYEADAQLAYLNLHGYAHLIISEDSDLLLFGAERVVFKFKHDGSGKLIERKRIKPCLGKKCSNFTFSKFRQMCILSGCDYLPSLPGIGLSKANRFFSMASSDDLRTVLPKVPNYLNMNSIKVSQEYIENFIKAEKTFKHQMVFEPQQRKLVPFTPYTDEREDFSYAGVYFDCAFELAIGNVNVSTLEKIDDFIIDDVYNQKRNIFSKNYKKPRTMMQIEEDGVSDDEDKTSGDSTKACVGFTFDKTSSNSASTTINNSPIVRTNSNSSKRSTDGDGESAQKKLTTKITKAEEDSQESDEDRYQQLFELSNNSSSPKGDIPISSDCSDEQNKVEVVRQCKYFSSPQSSPEEEAVHSQRLEEMKRLFKNNAKRSQQNQKTANDMTIKEDKSEVQEATSKKKKGLKKQEERTSSLTTNDDVLGCQREESGDVEVSPLLKPTKFSRNNNFKANNDQRKELRAFFDSYRKK